MSYAVKEMYYTLQGEGAQTGRPAVFLRFAGCNLWTGREADRADAICSFCDTDFVGTDGPGGGKFRTPEALADAVAAQWPGARTPQQRPYVVCTGGEPLLQLDAPAIAAMQAAGLRGGRGDERHAARARGPRLDLHEPQGWRRGRAHLRR